MTASPSRKPHPANVPGDFYVGEGCCISCGVPEYEAPDLFGWAGDNRLQHCFVKRQPETRVEVDQMLGAIHNGEAECIRYRGSDPDIMRRLVELGGGRFSDLPPPIDAVRVTRSHAKFSLVAVAQPFPAGMIAVSFLSSFVETCRSPHTAYGARMLTCDDRRVVFEISWHQGLYHEVRFEALGGGQWLAVTKPAMEGAGIGLSRSIERWLRESPDFVHIEWFSKEQWQADGPSSPTVI